MNAQTLVVRTDRSIERLGRMTHSEMRRLSELVEIAAVVSLGETMSGNALVYGSGGMAEYDPVSCELVGAHCGFDAHLGWAS